MATISPSLANRALEIADGFCRSEVEILGIHLEGTIYALTDPNGARVRCMDECDYRLVEALTYLQERGLACIGIGRDALFAQLLIDRFTEA